jgi:hypothetical protein
MGGKPFFQRAQKAFSDAVRFRSVAGNHDMDKAFVASQLPEDLSREMHAPVRDQKWQFSR